MDARVVDQSPAAHAPRLSPLQRGALAAEILRDYVPAMRTLRANDLPLMARSARAVQPHGRPVPPVEPYVLGRQLGGATIKLLRLLPTDSRCLIRSLVVLRLMRRRSLEGKLVIGVRPGPDFGAHAWVELDGRPVLPPGRYERLMEL